MCSHYTVPQICGAGSLCWPPQHVWSVYPPAACCCRAHHRLEGAMRTSSCGPRGPMGCSGVRGGGWAIVFSSLYYFTFSSPHFSIYSKSSFPPHSFCFYIATFLLTFLFSFPSLCVYILFINPSCNLSGRPPKRPLFIFISAVVLLTHVHTDHPASGIVAHTRHSHILSIYTDQIDCCTFCVYSLWAACALFIYLSHTDTKWDYCCHVSFSGRE